MPHPRAGRTEIYGFILTAIFALAFAAVVAVQRSPADTGATASPVALAAPSPTRTTTLSSPTLSETPASTATPTLTATPEPTATPDILDGAKLRTEGEAVAFALDYARGLGAKGPRLVSVELLEIEEAIARVDAQTGGAPGETGTGWGADGPAGWSWLMQFDNDEFAIPSCEPPYDPTPWPEDGSGHSCPTEPTAIFVMRASDGAVVAMALGPSVPL